MSILCNGIWKESSSHTQGQTFRLPALYLLVEVKPECEINEDCPSSDVCHQGSCQDACRFQTCGANAECSTTRHRARCTCLPGFSGDPYTACSSRKYSFQRGGGIIIHHAFRDYGKPTFLKRRGVKYCLLEPFYYNICLYCWNLTKRYMFHLLFQKASLKALKSFLVSCSTTSNRSDNCWLFVWWRLSWICCVWEAVLH